MIRHCAIPTMSSSKSGPLTFSVTGEASYCQASAVSPHRVEPSKPGRPARSALNERHQRAPTVIGHRLSAEFYGVASDTLK
jgi:hypothetical protein